MDTCQHTGIPVAFSQVFVHVPYLYLFADSIRKNTFQTISCGKLNATFFCNQQDNQSVVFSFFSHTVLFSQLISKFEAVTSVYLLYGYD